MRNGQQKISNKKFKRDSVNPRVFCKERKKSARSLRPLTKRYVKKINFTKKISVNLNLVR